MFRASVSQTMRGIQVPGELGKIHHGKRLRDSVRALRQPSGRWLRIPAGLLLMAGGVLAFLPILGLWMLPIGLALLADDVPLLRSWRSRMLDWVERSHPDWLDSGSRPHDPS